MEGCETDRGPSSYYGIYSLFGEDVHTEMWDPEGVGIFLSVLFTTLFPWLPQGLVHSGGS